ncbi:Hypothetical protein SMAX5B_006098 [Scophthalmus maximus]|uniref:Uncharacterized protein n=1 Tax=Scophthalmus maximus TaxID=52904 RepID=A0A2U9BJY7_SCOMX|nr:Hypothetical protein SMAX5B_006098 [Scophthalmus maximus]
MKRDTNAKCRNKDEIQPGVTDSSLLPHVDELGPYKPGTRVQLLSQVGHHQNPSDTN